MHALLRQVWRKSAVFTVGLLTVGLIVSGCGGSSGAAGATSTATTAPTATTNPNQAIVDITGSGYSGQFYFSPATITIKVGITVVWKNTSTVPHTSTSDTGSAVMWNSTIDPGSTFSFTFTRAGTFAYHCNIHPYMHGTIIVTS